MADRVLVSKSALKKLPMTAADGTPYCPKCRTYGELNLMMAAAGSTGDGECVAWSLPVYAESDRLTYEQMVAGEPCRGCGQELLAGGEPPSWVGKGSLFYTDDERAAHDAAERAFKQRHPFCHALRWRMQGSGVTHCARCCPPAPLSPGKWRQISQLLTGARDHRVQQARRDGTKGDPHELERRLPGRARPAALVLREYRQSRAATLDAVDVGERDLMAASIPEAELMFRWRIQLDCGDIVELLTCGTERVPSAMSWSWAGSPMREGTYGCGGHRAAETPYQQVRRYLRRSTLHLEADEKLERGPETVGYWTVELACGHREHQITPLRWHPRDGHRQTQPNDPREVAERKSRLEAIKDSVGALDYEHWILQIEQGRLEPDPMTTCETCSYEQPIIAFQRIGWLVPPTAAEASPAPNQAPPQPTRSELEHRVAVLEAELARLKGARKHR
ncbi:hypothetical protein [Actinoplanes sp. NBRC 103695]|uniref:hypothetical protein n=1 Tax=Actinoplanes sp. NBRC 103695 TaxID=3032202 RepID=UPI0024A367C5|nr:hypothetical protein [Actinoplanes sp. NBRC 103695]GLY96569.1 hypothetical protein Acsp02_38240 [Actinoplanes sp. NBRC 103695]